MGHTVIMGRRTWESLPDTVRPLPGRCNIVLTASNSLQGATTAHTIPEALAAADGNAWVIGGAATFAAALPFAQRAVITEIEQPFDGDVFAPNLADDEWLPPLVGPWLDSRAGLRYRIIDRARQEGQDDDAGALDRGLGSGVG